MTDAPGYVLAWRSKWEHPVFRRKQEAAVWAWMCETAQWQDYRMPTKFGPISLKRGELVIAEREVAEDFGLHRNTLRALIQRMVDEGMICLIRDRIPSRAGTIVSIVKYEQYQQVDGRTEGVQDRKRTGSEAEAGPQEDRSGTKNKQENTYKQEKEESPLPPDGGVSEPSLFQHPEPEADKPKKARKAATPRFTPSQLKPILDQFEAAYPAGDGVRVFDTANKTIARLVNNQGVDPQALVAAAVRYAQAMAAKGRVGTQYIMKPNNWLMSGEWKQYDGVHQFPNQKSSFDPVLSMNEETMEQWKARTSAMRAFL